MTFDAETQDFLDQLAARGPARAPATLSEIFSANWDAGGLTTPLGAAAPRAQALDELRAAYQSATGLDPREEARRQLIPIDAARPDDEAAVISMLAKSLPEEQRSRLAPALDINARASQIAAETERRAADVGARTFGLSGVATAFLAGAARSMVDPLNIAATAAVALATPAGAGVPAFLAREAAVNAGATAATLPGVNIERQRLGLEPAPFVQSVAESAVGGAALGGLFRAGGWALRRTFARAGAPDLRPGDVIPGEAPRGEEPPPGGFAPRAEEPPPAARESLAGLEPEDLDLAARHIELRDALDAEALRPDPVGVVEHARAVDDAAAALDRGAGVALDAPASPAEAEALAAAIDARARELSPRVFARADALDAQIAQARAEIQRVSERPSPDNALAGRIAAVEAELGQITGKRRSSPRAKALRAELESLAAERQSLIDEQARLDAEQLALLRENLIEMQSERANLGPKVRAVRAHAAGQVSPDRALTSEALRVSAARDAIEPRPQAAVDGVADRTSPPAPGLPSAPATQAVEAAPPAPPRALSDYPLREPAPPAPEPATPLSASPPQGGREPVAQAAPPAPSPARLPPELAAKRAEAERIVAEIGDAEIEWIDEATGAPRRVKPSELLREIDEDAAALREFEACLAGAPDMGEPQ